MITTESHNVDNKDNVKKKSKSQLSEIVIGNDIWVGEHCSILAREKIPTGSILAAGAVFLYLIVNTRFIVEFLQNR